MFVSDFVYNIHGSHMRCRSSCLCWLPLRVLLKRRRGNVFINYIQVRRARAAPAALVPSAPQAMSLSTSAVEEESPHAPYAS